VVGNAVVGNAVVGNVVSSGVCAANNSVAVTTTIVKNKSIFKSVSNLVTKIPVGPVVKNLSPLINEVRKNSTKILKNSDFVGYIDINRDTNSYPGKILEGYLAISGSSITGQITSITNSSDYMDELRLISCTVSIKDNTESEKSVSKEFMENMRSQVNPYNDVLIFTTDTAFEYEEQFPGKQKTYKLTYSMGTWYNGTISWDYVQNYMAGNTLTYVSTITNNRPVILEAYWALADTNGKYGDYYTNFLTTNTKEVIIVTDYFKFKDTNVMDIDNQDFSIQVNNNLFSQAVMYLSNNFINSTEFAQPAKGENVAKLSVPTEDKSKYSVYSMNSFYTLGKENKKKCLYLKYAWGVNNSISKVETLIANEEDTVISCFYTKKLIVRNDYKTNTDIRPYGSISRMRYIMNKLG
jgi:hypothetical protein